MEVLRIGQVIQKGQNANDVKPPHEALIRDERPVRPSAEQPGEQAADRIISIADIVISPARTQNLIGRIHGEECRHKQHLNKENHIGVETGKAIQVFLNEALDFDDIAANIKRKHTNEHERRKHFESGNEHFVKTSEEGCKHAVGSEYAIDNDLEHFDVDDHKAYIHENVKDAGNGSNHHFRLPKGHKRHDFPALAGVVAPV